MVEEGFSSIDPIKARGPQISAGEFTRRRRSSGGRKSTLQDITPSASELTGTAQEREAQLEAFRSGGRLSFEALKQQQRQAQAQAQIEAQEKIRIAAENKKQAELFAIRQQRINELIAETREQGRLINEIQAYSTIKMRERSEIEAAGKEARALAGATGEVQKVPEVGLAGKSGLTRTATKGDIRKIEVTDVKTGSRTTATGDIVEGKFESRVISTEGGIKETRVYFVPDFGSEQIATPQEAKKFREEQQEVQPLFQAGGIQGVIQSIETKEKIKSTADIRRGETGSTLEVLTSIGSGAAASVLGTIAFAQQAVTSPLETLKSTEKSIIELSRGLESGALIKDLTTLATTQPAFSVGFLTAEIGQDILLGKAGSFLGDIGKRTITRFRPDFTPVITKADTGIKVLEDVTDIGRIELIPPQGFEPLKTLSKEQIKSFTPDITDTAAFKGAFGFSAEEISSLTGKRGTLLTSARDLFGVAAPGKVDIAGKVIKTVPQPGFGDISLFVSPFRIEDGLSIAQTRISRLGSQAPTANIFDILKGDFTIGRKKSQFVAFTDQVVGEDFLPKQFTPGELELTLRGERLIKKTGTAGRTIIDKQPVEIILAEFADLPEDLATDVKKLRAGTLTPDAQDIVEKKITKFSGFDVSDIRVDNKPVVGVSTFSPSASIVKLLPSPSVSRKPSFGAGVSPGFSPGFSPGKSGFSPGVSVSPDVSPGKSGFSPGNISKILKSSGVSVSPGVLSPFVPSPIVPKPSSTITPKLRFQPVKKKKRGVDLFGVSVRRGGEFGAVTTTKDLNKALGLGVERVGGTLAATFKLTGAKGLKVKTPKGFYRKLTKKGEVVFIERRGLRLSRVGEVKEITRAKRKKRKRN